MAKRQNKYRNNDPEGLRNRVLDVAARSFQDRGYAGTAMHDIVNEAGITGGALYHHFPSKKELGLAVIRQRVSIDVDATWVKAVELAPTAAEGVLAVFESVAAKLEARGIIVGCPLNNLTHELSLIDDELRSALASEYAIWRDAIVARLKLDQAAGKARHIHDPESLANTVVAMFSGAMALAKAEQNTAALKDCAAYLKILMEEVDPSRGRKK